MILEDILEGYFPSVLRQRYPDGVLFKFYNKVDQDFKTCQEKGFINDFGTDDRGYIAETREELLNKLPKNVIKNGKIIPIRDEIAKNFKNNPGLLKAKGIEDRVS